jgi:hypothetical protein
VEAFKDPAQDERLLEILADLLPLATRHRGDHDDEEPVHRVRTKAGALPPPETNSPRSVFELGYSVASAPVRLHRYCVPGSSTGSAASASAPPRRAVNIVARAGDRVRVSGLAYPGDRWTAERAEKERIRRAKQIVPRPSAAAKQFNFKREPLVGAAA